MKEKKTAREKLESIKANIVEIPPRMQGKYGEGRMLIPKPLDIDALIRSVPPGRLITYNRIREVLAERAGVEVTCPMTTGIFVSLCAKAAEEDRAEGKEDITPYWRVVKEDGRLNEKFPGGAKAQAKRLEEEGHRIEKAKGKKPPRVKDYERWLV